MAVRLNLRHQPMVREKIKTSQLINRLQDHVLKGVRMHNSQVRAACYLISQAIGQPPQEIKGALEVDHQVPVDPAELTDEEIVRRLEAIDERRRALRDGRHTHSVDCWCRLLPERSNNAWCKARVTRDR